MVDDAQKAMYRYLRTMSHNGRLTLPESEMTWRFSRSSGAGGQHVNTTDTRVELTGR